VKKSACVIFSPFRRKPESSIFKPLRISWTPVFTGVTTKRQFFHTFPPQGGGKFFLLHYVSPLHALAEWERTGWKSESDCKQIDEVLAATYDELEKKVTV
jgi:hypothetical protein